MKGLFSVVALALVSNAAARTFTVYNNCPFTIWPAIFTGAGGATRPSQPGGWAQNAYEAVSFEVNDGWTAGRIWARRDCDFSVNPGPTSCLDGGCNGGLVCDPTTGTGVPPASLAEFTLNAAGNTDFYDISLVDGYNLPISITNNVGCPAPSCPVDLGPGCPAALQGPYDSSGFPVGCRSACDAGLGNTANGNYDCCTGAYDTQATCPPSGVDYYSYFHDTCPDAYAYAYDEATGSALWTCPGSLEADYTITFCASP